MSVPLTPGARAGVVVGVHPAEDFRPNNITISPNRPHTADPASAEFNAMLGRIRGEFLEMPGLRLTDAQARRLWGLDDRTCAALLEALVDAKLLVRSTDGRLTNLDPAH